MILHTGSYGLQVNCINHRPDLNPVCYVEYNDIFSRKTYSSWLEKNCKKLWDMSLSYAYFDSMDDAEAFIEYFKLTNYVHEFEIAHNKMPFPYVAWIFYNGLEKSDGKPQLIDEILIWCKHKLSEKFSYDFGINHAKFFLQNKNDYMLFKLTWKQND